MICQTISLTPQFPEAFLKTYILETDLTTEEYPRPAVIVCPGGGYVFQSNREAEPIALSYAAAGMNTYILYYSVGANASNYRPLIEVAEAVKYVREHAAEHRTDPNRIFTCGFSAGGHLAASAGILWNHPVVRDALGISDGKAPEGINRPNGMILSYPVITTGEFTHQRSALNLCGNEHPTKEELDRFSLELHVDETTVPAFIWHTVSDTSVPVQNSLFLMSALAANKVPFEAHIYPNGPHGLSLANFVTWTQREDYVNPHVDGWMELSIKWIEDCN